ncbi:PREDICTED: LOW QUALITY PROTEIN: bifunctional epoxide hydrolase 2 [Tarenaya hassleriana]|uniref:LOW QUALITY PROTEIN: bifunctional epoxide hydrolase 2 n=1 Tax=Tarenaya hassleriana TaxID=28532 RepID=UPI00053C88D4|nr:PREDICTED: LOW QUALITY PROTEIN: bifunctional epoxide hydrolase 2 [Tarenaya hassleriana]
MKGVREERIKSNGIWMKVAEKGDGPMVILLHGFPETSFSWRHQIEFLSESGFHVVAPDLRGYSDSDSPPRPDSYSILHLAGVIGLLDHYNAPQAFVVGHDWGAQIGWHLSLFRPDRVKGFISLSVPYFPRNPLLKPIQFFNANFGDGFYISQFQEPGRARRLEAAFARYDCLTVMKKFLLITSTNNLVAPPGMEIIDHLQTPPTIPEWIAEEELQVYAEKFQKSGFTGPLSYYRAMDLNWELTRPWQDSKITVPTKFIIGNKDIGYEGANGTNAYVNGDVFKRFVPDLDIIVLDGHHFIQQEKPKEVSDEILSFLTRLLST